MSDEKLLAPDQDPREEHFRLENDILRMKLRAEFGTDLQLADDLPPRLQHVILQQLYNFERITHLKVPKIPVYKKIGSPPFVPCAELTEQMASRELVRLMELLRRHHIVLDVLATYEAKRIYQFVTEEFFALEIDDFPASDWNMYFCYEHFYPNHDHDLRNSTTLFIDELMGKELHEQFNPLHGQMLTSANETISDREAYKRILDFYENFSSFRLHDLQLGSVSFDRVHGLVPFNINFDGMLDNGESVNMQGEGKIHFIKSRAGGWNIHKIEMPGLCI